jgi:mannan endo-1,4-beta-mannosidase
MASLFTTAAVVVSLGAAACAVGAYRDQHVPATAHVTRQPPRYLGVIGPSLASFGKATGVRPNLTVCYVKFGEPFPSRFVREDAAVGAQTLVELLPRRTSLHAVADGSQNTYLLDFAEAARATGDAVLMSFAPEADGSWYPWGVPNASPAGYIAAWRHVHNVFASAGVRNVTWVWQMSTLQGSRTLPHVLASLWPGSSYVNIVGLDGYYYLAAASFQSVFGVTLGEIRQITRDPVLITETAAGTGIGQAAKVAELFAGIRKWHLLGLVWFDRDQAPHHASLYRQDWQLEGDPAALEVFRDDARAYLRQAGTN